ncbi:MAG TPA: DUF1569 domain-containing protein [Bacteroidia bacterium]|jgi:hypothetical protein|nr:DUF1569 domain-containing protein [Bacteroidia bacterium]MBP7714255.1 DUF1569 domain-containing protein [Bacteroidia bacterium]HOZ89312.1 DUF1569 domain-containing protein [Bacteroidia bacterium]HQW17539.1 DUF1569 domain-containing protein [Bacteroidia bacterium]HQW48981.1 DUF1569 domain-containing protein [Bacteroidia bacterium]
MINPEKLQFLKNNFIELLKKLKGDEVPAWGKMNAQQMIEHFGDAIEDACGKNNRTLITPPDKLEAVRAFILSDKDFKPNTKNSLMSDAPAPTQMPDLAAAIARVENGINEFEAFYSGNPEKKVMNPFFGELNYAENIQLLHKHALHHLRQFNLI